MSSVLSLGLTDRDRVEAAFGGGLPTGSIALIEGADGAGKSVISQRLAFGLADAGAPVAYLSSELSAGEFIEQMHSLSYDVVDHLLAERLLFMEIDVDTRNWARERPRDLISRLLRGEVIWRGDVVIVDRFDSVIRNDPRFDPGEPSDGQEIMETLVANLRRKTRSGRVVVLTLDSDGLGDELLRPLRSVADIYLELEMNNVGQELRRNMVVRRFAGMAAPVDDTIGFTVQQGRGITIESRTVA